jgi:cytochrome c oxidase assembly protein subunit 11
MENQSLTQKNNKLMARLGAVIVLMFGFGFALVPLYDVFCDITGLNGRNVTRAQSSSRVIDSSRTVRLQFTTAVASDMPWRFEPMTKYVDVHPGENKMVKFLAHNLAGNSVIGQAVPSVSPGIAALYLNKTECFCFNQQLLASGEQAEMGLTFFISPDIPKDINTMTLSYSLFNVTKNQAGPEQAGL